MTTPDRTDRDLIGEAVHIANGPLYGWNDLTDEGREYFRSRGDDFLAALRSRGLEIRRTTDA